MHALCVSGVLRECFENGTGTGTGATQHFGNFFSLQSLHFENTRISMISRRILFRTHSYLFSKVSHSERAKTRKVANKIFQEKQENPQNFEDDIPGYLIQQSTNPGKYSGESQVRSEYTSESSPKSRYDKNRQYHQDPNIPDIPSIDPHRRSNTSNSHLNRGDHEQSSQQYQKVSQGRAQTSHTGHQDQVQHPTRFNKANFNDKITYKSADTISYPSGGMLDSNPNVPPPLSTDDNFERPQRELNLPEQYRVKYQDFQHIPERPVNISAQMVPYIPFQQPNDPSLITVTIIGPPNVGKSTMINSIIGRDVMITSPKAQTTREKFVGNWTEGNIQVLFSDTPGIVGRSESKAIFRDLVNASWEAIENVDAIIFMVDATGTHIPPDVLYALNRLSKTFHKNLPLSFVTKNDNQNKTPNEPYFETEPLENMKQERPPGTRKLLRDNMSSDNEDPEFSDHEGNLSDLDIGSPSDLIEAFSDSDNDSRSGKISQLDSSERPSRRPSRLKDIDSESKDFDPATAFGQPEGSFAKFSRDYEDEQILQKLRERNTYLDLKNQPDDDPEDHDHTGDDVASAEKTDIVTKESEENKHSDKNPDKLLLDMSLELAHAIEESMKLDPDTGKSIEEGTPALKSKAPRLILVVNKMDKLNDAEVNKQLISRLMKQASPLTFDKIFFASAQKRQGLDQLKLFIQRLAKTLPNCKNRPWMFSPNHFIEISEYRLFEEILREQLYRTLPQELPYTVKQLNLDWTNLPDHSIRIRQRIVPPRPSIAKQIVGRKGAVINAISQRVQEKLIPMIKRPVILNLDVDVSTRVDTAVNIKKKANRMHGSGSRSRPISRNGTRRMPRPSHR